LLHGLFHAAEKLWLLQCTGHLPAASMEPDASTRNRDFS
jgi:hypothetical protein